MNKYDSFNTVILKILLPGCRINCDKIYYSWMLRNEPTNPFNLPKIPQKNALPMITIYNVTSLFELAGLFLPIISSSKQHLVLKLWNTISSDPSCVPGFLSYIFIPTVSLTEIFTVTFISFLTFLCLI